MHSHRLALNSAQRHLLAGSVVVASGVLVHNNKDRLANLRVRLSSTVIEAVSGAAGEVAQIALVYPLDTVKVRCQAAGVSSRQVFANLWASTGGDWAAIFSALYAGALPAAALAILVGSVHYCCFCSTRRALVSVTAAADASSSSRSSSQPHGGTDPLLQHQHHDYVIVSHGATGTHFLPIEDQPADKDASLGSSSSSTSQAGPAAAGPGTGGAAAAAAERPMSQEVGEGSMTVNITSSVITAAITALVEAPLELFRHNSQAGQIQGNFVKEMWRVLRKSGPRALYFGLIPYCFESWPYDISELLVIGAAKDMRDSPAVAHMKPAAYDLTVGGLAGTVAVLVSMPFDVVKTYVQTHPSGMASEGLWGSAGAFWSTGKALVAKGGPGALFVGLWPRLAHQVPGAMVCWLVIESCHRHLSQAAALQHTAAAADREVQPR